MESKQNSFTFTGKSGKEYRFLEIGGISDSHPISGVYILASLKMLNRDDDETNVRLETLYIGESDNIYSSTKNHQKQKCLKEHGYNLLLIYECDEQSERIAASFDLLESKDKAYWTCQGYTG